MQGIEDRLLQLQGTVGGISAQLEEILRKVILSRGPMEDIFKKRGLKPIKGMLLEGPPGTEKITLARQSAKCLGAKKESVFNY